MLNTVVREAQQRCPVAHTDAYGGYYPVAGHGEPATRDIARHLVVLTSA